MALLIYRGMIPFPEFIFIRHKTRLCYRPAALCGLHTCPQNSTRAQHRAIALCVRRQPATKRGRLANACEADVRPRCVYCPDRAELQREICSLQGEYCGLFAEKVLGRYDYDSDDSDAAEQKKTTRLHASISTAFFQDDAKCTGWTT
jgi:hypothetical protein